MLRWTKRIAVILTCILALLLYREWVRFTKPKLFLPLGFFETSLSPTSTEEAARDPRSWRDPLSPIVIDLPSFEREARSLDAVTESDTDILVIGATLGGAAAAAAAAENNARVVLVSASPSLGDEWGVDAGLLPTELRTATGGLSPIENALRAWMRRRYAAGGLPRDVTAFMASYLAERGVRLKTGFTPIAFAGSSPETIDRALLRSIDGTSAIVVPFSYLLDGTPTGDLFALTNTETTSGWDAREETGEPDILPQAAVRALAEGYTQSGRTIPGMGYRLDGGSDVIAILDRGYHGTFMPPAIVDSCWTKDPLLGRPFTGSGVVFRASRAGCSMSINIDTSFEDIVEVFAIQDRNDGLSATAHLGQRRIPLSINIQTDPSDRLVSIGSFPVSPGQPLSITLRSTLPTDRFEGVIVRKQNIGTAPLSAIPDTSGTATIEIRAWKRSVGDVYVVTAGDGGSPELLVESARYPLARIGARTWKATNVPLRQGDNAMTVEGGAESIIAVPLAPQQETVARFGSGSSNVSRSTPRFPPIAGASTILWNVEVDRDGAYALLAHPQTCGEYCGVSITETGTLVPLSQNVQEGIASSPIESAVLDTFSLEAGRTYVIAFARRDGLPPSDDLRLIRLDEDKATLWTETAGSADVIPEHGGLYDVWASASQTTVVTAEVGGTAERLPVEDGALTFIGTHYLSPRAGVRVSGGGTVRIVALPNTWIDTYRQRFASSPTETTVPFDLPAGRYTTWWEGEAVPAFVTVRTSAGIGQPLALGGRSGPSPELLLHDGEPLLLTVPARIAPLETILYETTPAKRARGSASGALLPLLSYDIAKNLLPPHAANIAQGSGILLLHTSPGGIGPVTLGSIGSESLERRLYDAAEREYALLRMRSPSATCTTPACDPRRLARAPFVFDTPTAHAPHPRLVDGRRLRGMDTLTTSGAFLHVTTCHAVCEPVCAGPRNTDGRCIARTQPTSIRRETVLTIDGVSPQASIDSPVEQASGALRALLALLRGNRVLGRSPTYLERTAPPRPVQLTIGMFAQQHSRVLPAHATISATHAAARSLRSVRAQLAVGDVAGRIAGFALHTGSPPDVIASDASALAALRLHLIEHGVTVFPLTEIHDDPLLQRAVQRLVLEERTAHRSLWNGGILTYTADALDRTASTDERATALFGRTGVFTVRDLLERIWPQDADNPGALLRNGVSSGLLSQSMLYVGFNELFTIAIDGFMLLKAEELIQHPANEY